MNRKSNSAAKDFKIIKEHFSDENSDSWHWIFYGDSITHGAKHTHGWRSFPEIFNERVRWELHKSLDIIINSAFSGNSTINLTEPEQYQKRVRCFAPDVVFIMVGINDIIRINDAEQYRKNLTELVKMVRADNAIPILQTCMPFKNKPEDPNYVKRYQERPLYNKMIREVAASEDVILIDQDAAWEKFAVTQETLEEMLGEELHPGALGHLECAKEIFRKLDIFDSESDCCNPIGTYHSILSGKNKQ